MKNIEKIGPYRITSVLGEGGMGVVYSGIDEISGRTVAIKTVKVFHEELVESIRHEIRALTKLKHPGIVEIFADGIHDSIPWYAMQLLEGSSLGRMMATYRTTSPTSDTQHASDLASGHAFSEGVDDTIQVGDSSSGIHERENSISGPDDKKQKRNIFEPAKIIPLLKIIQELCSALSFLHGEGIVHRDLKPGNVIISNGLPVLVDFGIFTRFSAINSRDSVSVEGGVIGTPHYMSPEQIRGDLVDARADLYSLGCILYEIVCGHPPFISNTSSIIYRAHLKSIPVPPSRFCNGLPQKLESLITNLLSKEPRKRIGYADIVAKQLDSICGKSSSKKKVACFRPYLYRAEFAGRISSLSHAAKIFDVLSSGGGSFLFIGGESGVGKTRFGIELSRLAQLRAIQVYTGECLDGISRPLLPFRKTLSILHDFCRRAGEVTTAEILGDGGKIIGQYFREFQDLPGFDSFPEPPDGDYQRMKFFLFNALWEALKKWAGQEKLMLLLDDVHWADDLTLSFLEHILDEKYIVESPLIICCTYRTEEKSEVLHQLITHDLAESIILERLKEDAVASIVGDMLALSPAPEQLSRIMSRHSEGNPFFVAEYLRSAVDENLLWRDGDGNWHIGDTDDSTPLESEFESLPVPGSLIELVQRRLVTLTADEREMLENAAIMGRKLDLNILKKIVLLEENAYHDALNGLLRRNLFERVEADYHFSHDKIRESILPMMTMERATELHKNVALTIENTYAGTLEQYFAQLGQHWSSGGNREKARFYFKSAAERAMVNNLFDEAEQYFSHYFLNVSKPDAVSIQLRNMFAGNILFRLGKMELALEQAHTALKEAIEIDAITEKAMSLRFVGYLLFERGDYQTSEPYLLESLFIYKNMDHLRGEASLLGDLGRLYLELHNYDEASRYFRKTIEKMTQIGAGTAIMWNNLALVYLYQGKLETAFETLQKGLEAEPTIDAQREKMLLLTNMGDVCTRQGKFELANDFFEQALIILENSPELNIEAYIYGCLGKLLLGRGDYQRSGELLEKAYKLHLKVGSIPYQISWLKSLVTLNLEQGFIADAEKLLERVKGLFIKNNDRELTDDIVMFEADILRLQGRTDEAMKVYHEIIDTMIPSQDTFIQTMAKLILAQMYRSQFGEYEKAKELIDDIRRTNTKDTEFSISFQLAIESAHLSLAMERPLSEACLFAEMADNLALSMKLLSNSKNLRQLQSMKKALKAASENKGDSLLHGEYSSPSR